GLPCASPDREGKGRRTRSRAGTALSISDEELHRLVLEARCILWRARVTMVDGKLDTWDLHIHSDAAAQRFLPVETFANQTYGDAWYRSKHPDDIDQMYETAQNALLRGEPGYTQEFRCRQIDGEERWLREDVQSTNV